LKGSLSNYSFLIGQKVWLYWKTTVIEMWDNSTLTEENLQNEVDEPNEIVEG